MIPVPGCDPRINVLVIGAYVLRELKGEGVMLDSLLQGCSIRLKVSVDHVILTLDWLYMIGAIKVDNNWVKINAADIT